MKAYSQLARTGFCSNGKRVVPFSRLSDPSNNFTFLPALKFYLQFLAQRERDPSRSIYYGSYVFVYANIAFARKKPDALEYVFCTPRTDLLFK